MRERVQKFLSNAGVASRRKAEEFILSGQVLINGKKAKLGDKVDETKDVIKVYGKIVQPAKEKIYLAINKPKGYVVSKKDPRGRKTVFSLLPEDLRNKVWNVGRLDADTEGLLILTNDGELTQQLSHPKFEHEKEYEVLTANEPSENQLEKLRRGVQIVTGLTYPAKARLMHRKDLANPHPSLDYRSGHLLPKGEGNKVYAHVVRITLHEGKKRQIRRMFAAVGLEVQNLRRIRINKLLLLKNLSPGQFRAIKKTDIV